VTGDLDIRVIQGEDGINIIKKNSAVKPVVEVRDKNNLPVAGATVVFTLPGSGPSAVFAGGSKSVTLSTNSAGRAAVSRMNPVGTGPFKIDVTATFRGLVATASIAQTNVETAADADAANRAAAGAAAGAAGAATIGKDRGKKISSGKIAIIAAI